MKPLYFPGYIQNFKGKQYNSDDLSGVLCQYQLSYRDIDSIISSRDEEEEEDSDDDESNEDSNEEDEEDGDHGSSMNHNAGSDGESDTGNPKGRKAKTGQASRTPPVHTMGAVKSKKGVKKRKKEGKGEGSPGGFLGGAEDANDSRFKDMVKQYCIKRENSILKKSSQF